MSAAAWFIAGLAGVVVVGLVLAYIGWLLTGAALIIAATGLFFLFAVGLKY